MNGQTYALLGQWYDMVGQQHGRGGGFRGGAQHRGGRRYRGYGYGGGYGGYPLAYGYDQGDQSYDPNAAAYWAAYFAAQQQAQQVPVPVPVPVPAAMPPAAPPVSGWYDLTGPGVGADAGAGLPFPAPRAAVVDAPLPTQANRDILPMSTGVPILPTQSAQITGRPQTLVFKIGRFVISNAGTAGGAADWIVNDIKIGNRSQFVQSGDVPGDLFATNAIDTFVRFEAAQTAMDVVVVVTYIGLNESGCPFFGAMVGTAAV
jgi:hypothetical protein